MARAGDQEAGFGQTADDTPIRRRTVNLMPSSVDSLLERVGLEPHSVTSWGASPSVNRAGVYLVSTSSSPSAVDGEPACTLSEERLRELILARPELTVAGVRPTVEQLAAALYAMWPAGKTVLYIGLAAQTVRGRVEQYYATRLGARAPHAGGWPVKTLAGMGQLFVHASPCDDPAAAERAMLQAFMAGVTASARAVVCDPDLPLPFANLQLDPGTRKRHGIRGARESRGLRGRTHLTERTDAERRDGAVPAKYATPVGRSDFLLNLTAADVTAGQIRITARPKEALGLPRERALISIVLHGKRMDVTWDPRIGPDRERSGLLRVPTAVLRRSVGGACALRISTGDDNCLHLD